MTQKSSKSLSDEDYAFMHSLSAAVLQKASNKLRIVMYFWILTVVVLIVWAEFAQIDEISRGSGDVVPSGENQLVQNLEGGIVKEILVTEGELVKKGQVLIKIDNQRSNSSFSTNSIKAKAIEAKIIRLTAEASGKVFKASSALKNKIPLIIANELSLYETNKKQLNSKLDALKSRLFQKKQELTEARSTKNRMKNSYALINREVTMTRPMVAKGVRSKIDFLKLQREANEVKDKYDAARLSIPRLKSAINEVQSTIAETKYTSKSDAKLKLNAALADLKTYQSDSTALKDEVDRMLVRAPMKGIIQKLYVHTIGGVLKPGEDILEIVPVDAKLLVAVRVKPSDIAFIYYGQKATVKFTAYDYAIYGGLSGKVVLISPDTIKDEKGDTFYEVKIQTDKSYLTRNGKQLKIMQGMTVKADIITGRKSVLDYILKPILKTKQYTFTER